MRCGTNTIELERLEPTAATTLVPWTSSQLPAQAILSWMTEDGDASNSKVDLNPEWSTIRGQAEITLRIMENGAVEVSLDQVQPH